MCGGVCSLLLACTRAPQQRFNLESLEVTGNDEIDDDEIEEKIASRETSRFLGLFPGVIYDYEIFNRFVLERDLQRVERFYRSRGFYQARARAAHVFRSGSKVRVEIVVEEGPPLLLRRVDVHGVQKLPAEVREDALEAATSRIPIGARFEEEAFSDSSKALARALADHGYAQAVVRKSADVSLTKNSASAGFWVEAGEVSELGAIKLEGLGDLPEDNVRRTLGLKPGDTYSQTELDEAKRALLDLGVFSSVNIEPQVDNASPGPSGKPRVPLLVKLERSKLRSIRLGGGVQLDAIKSDFHLTAGWEDQSFLGGMRKMLVEVVPGAVVYPTRFPTFEAPERLLPQARVRTEFRQPGFLEARTSGILKAQFKVEPLLFTKRDPDAAILGYRDYRASAGVDRSFRRLYGYLSQNVQINQPFVYVEERKGCPMPEAGAPPCLPLSDALQTVVITYPSLLATLDLRDDPLKPHKGLFLSTEVQVASVFGDARDVKVLPEVRAYVPLTRRTTIAARGAFGLLFPSNYGHTVESNALTGSPGLTGDPVMDLKPWAKDIQLMFFRGLFAGGAGSNRGYAAREIGPHGVIPYFIPGQAAQDIDATCAGGGGTVACDLPLGGFTLWEASLEFRYPIVDALSGTVFTDAADVSPRQVSFRLRPHLSAGAGLRYDTPVGPIRFDVGYRVPGLQAPEGALDEGTPETFTGLELPIAISFGIGESF